MIDRSFLAWILLGVLVSAQAPERLVCGFDGHPEEALVIEGRGAFLGGNERRQGLSCLRVLPSSKAKYFGVTVRNLEGGKPKAIAVDVFQLGTKPAGYRVRLDGWDRGVGYAAVHRECQPGWNELRIELKGLSDPKGRKLDLSRGIKLFQFSKKRAEKIENEFGFLVDNLRFVDEEPVKQSAAVLARRAKGKNAQARVRFQEATLPLAPADIRQKIGDMLWKWEDSPPARRHLRFNLASDPSGSICARFLAEAKRKKADEEMLWTLGSTALPEQRKDALALAMKRGLPVTGRCALIRGLARKGHHDVASLVQAIPPKDPWPLRAALVEALRIAGTVEAVDALIELLVEPGSPRVQGDLLDALEALTGKSLGENPEDWRAWWKVNRGKLLDEDVGAEKKDAYDRFFGIPVRPGRIAFVIDVSGSMRDPVDGDKAQEHLRRAPYLKGKEITTRLELVRAEFQNAITKLGRDSYVSLVLYNDEALCITRGLERCTDALKRKLAKRVESTAAQSYTNIHDGLFRAFHPGRKPGRNDWKQGPDTIYLLTDGNPSRGAITKYTALRDAVIQWNLGRAIKIHTINVGNTNNSLLEGLSRSSGGRFVDLGRKRKKGKR